MFHLHVLWFLLCDSLAGLLHLLQVKLTSLGSILPTEVEEAMDRLLERNAVAAGHVTLAGLKTALLEFFAAALSPSGLASLVQNSGGASSVSGGGAASQPGQQTAQSFSWEDGTTSLVPEDWKLGTTCPWETMWELWLVGTPPLRDLLAAQVPKKAKKTFQKLEWLMAQVETAVKATEGAWVQNPSVEQARQMLEKVHDQFELPALKNGRVCRDKQLSWATFVNLWGEELKKRKRSEVEEDEADGDEEEGSLTHANSLKFTHVSLLPPPPEAPPVKLFDSYM